MEKRIVKLPFISLALLCVSSFAHQTLVMAPGSFQAPNELRIKSVLHDEDGFHILQDDNLYSVKKHEVDRRLRNIKQQQLEAFLRAGYLSVNKMSDGEYKIDAKVRGLGGGPLCATIAYWTTKATSYGLLAYFGGKAITNVGISIGGSLGGAVGQEIGGAIGGATGTLTGIAVGGGPVVEGITKCPAAIELGAVIVGGITSAPLTSQAVEQATQTVVATAVATSGTEVIAKTVLGIEIGSKIVAAIFAGPWCP